ncbi:hypothetical protein BASA50_000247 [Batrachochytrium salamandrivorans]|uniref:NADH dehydrogenase [ubiquinone] 1 beta subcomplex subunit 4 n=1 Tax=Batrachochytrium salamandrivorans TaxID=1357716 RepID=A0ABQ8EUP1_9FUNG|nr:hypothetical protein BASA62_009945 [Batrachochytrium salamandrivorans]KAH6566152.1 hypothetical protein BASA60_009607 [Batrachochytrium salamandrivorans]KAH6573094.1 hypothetical protein BASA62_003128 [Batrachochytrium salamandrivorans]KAH6580493.1 hypothetical protein BASA61_009607 [Batrachochytrium salamandrivorans]KAH6586883.1 hypothetical protein BASA50_000247 [Batrachochytrium salamandrivorans]
MGGHGHGKYPPLLIDPAIEKWYHMRENTHSHFKFNRRTVFISVMLTLAIPGLLWYAVEKNARIWSVGGASRHNSYLTSSIKKETETIKEESK